MYSQAQGTVQNFVTFENNCATQNNYESIDQPLCLEMETREENQYVNVVPKIMGQMPRSYFSDLEAMLAIISMKITNEKINCK